MRGMITGAWMGWRNYTDDGKLVALFLAAVLFLWLWKKEYRKKYNALLWYASVMAICCICPVLAAVLMKYQTRFYDYQWIWSMVPLTILIALAGTLLWDFFREKRGKCVAITIVMLALLYLCGGMQKETLHTTEETQKRERTGQILEILTEDREGDTICLWAPQEVMEYARALDGSILLPYGRNMWDKALGAYSYDTYGEPEETMYEWMRLAEETGEPEGIDGVILAKEAGVNCILLPNTIQSDILEEIQKVLNVQAQQTENYYLLWI